MADDVDVTLRLRAVDDTGRVLDDAGRRAKAFADQLTQGLTASTNATTKLTAATNAQTQASNAVAAATQKHAQATAGQTAFMNAATNVALKYASGLLSVTAAIETARRGVISFAESSRVMERVQLGSGATTKEIEKLSGSFEHLAGVTGHTANEIGRAFNSFRSQSGMALGPAAEAFDKIVLSAHAADVGIDTMSRAAVTAMTNMKVPASELGGVLATWATTLPREALEVWAEAGPRITSMLQSMGFTGARSAEQAAAAFGDLTQKMGSTRVAATTLEGILSKAKDVNTTLGLMSTTLIDNLKNDPDKINKLMSSVYENAKGMGLFDPNISSGQRSLIQNWLQLDDREVQGLQHIGERLDKINKVAKDLNISFDAVNNKVMELNKGPQAAVDRLAAAMSALWDRVGATFGVAVPDELGKYVRGLVNDLDRAAALMQKLRELTGSRDKETGEEKPRGGWNLDKVIPGTTIFGTQVPGGPARGPGEGPALPPEERKRIDDEQRTLRDRLKKEGLVPHATGGEFTVPGSGRGDDQPVSFMGTPGERVTIASIPEQDRKESLQRQQDKADQALQEHFARFRGKSRPGAQLGSGMPSDIFGRGAGGGGGGGGGGGDPAGGTRTGTGTGGGGQASGSGPQTGTPGTPGVGDTPLNTPVGLDPASTTGPAESLDEAYKRGYLKPPAAASSGGGDAAFLANYRKQYTEEIKNNPAVRNAVANILSHESDNVTAKTAVLEAWIVRAIQNKDKSILDDVKRGFFGPVNRNEVNPNAPASKFAADQSNAALAAVAGGSNLTDFRNDSGTNRQGNPEIPRGTTLETAGVIKPGGEHVYYADKAGRAYADQKRAEMIAARTGVPVADGAGAPQLSTTGDLKKQLEGGNTGTLSEQDKWIAQRYNGHDWTWKDDKAAAAAGMTRDQYVVGGMDPRVRQAMYEQGTKYEKETGNKFEFTSGFRGDYRQSLITSGVHAPTGLSHHGGSQIDLGGTGKGGDKNYGYGGAFDSTPEFGAWLKRQGSGTGIAWTGEHIGGDPYHVSGAWTREAAKFGLKMTPQQLAELTERTKAAREREEKTKVAGPAAVSDVETRAAARYKAAQERAASGTSFPPIQRDTAPVSFPPIQRDTPQPVKRAIPPPGKEGSKSKAVRPAAPAPVAHPVSAEGHEDTAAGKGARPAPEGKQFGGPVEADTPYMVGEAGPELITPSASGNVTSNSNLQATISSMRSQLEQPIEPIVRPRIQQFGPQSMRWGRQSERKRHQDISRDQARASHVDQGFA